MFHDFPAESVNVDHVVIAPQGVFAVQTKGCTKPDRSGGADDAKVVYRGETLAFPTRSGSKPLQWAQRQAAWPGKWLTTAAGEPVQAAPVMALPGWYVESKGRGEVLMFSGSELRKHLPRARTAQSIAPEPVQRIVHQVEQCCRHVPPGCRPVDGAEG